MIVRWAACIFAAMAAVLSAPVCSGGEKNLSPVSPEEKKRLLEAETAEQKKLREEIRQAGGRIYFSCKGQIWVVGVDGTEEKQITAFSEGRLEYPHVSPDGKKFVAEQGGNKSIGPDRFLIRKLDEKGAPPAKRSMGNRLVWLFNADGSDPQPLGEMWSPHWYPNGKAIVGNLNMQGKRNRPIVMFDLEKMEEHVLSPPDWPNHGSCGFACITPDGKWALSTNQAPIAIPLNDAGNGMAEGGKLVKFFNGSGGCNTDVSRDGKWVTWTIDTFGEAGGWIYYAPLDLPKQTKAEKAKLGWAEKTVNYDSDFSPDGKYMVYMHGDVVPGKKSYEGVPSEIYVTRFPPDGVNVRITWLGGNARHPHWVKP